MPEGDAGSRAAEIESAVLTAYGAINPKYKAKIRSIWVNLKDTKNPDFRQAVLSGEISGQMPHRAYVLSLYNLFLSMHYKQLLIKH